jgi:hypothetical protein
MSLSYTLPAGEYFLGDAAHLYHTTSTKPPALDENVPDNEEFLDWFLNDIAFTHHHPKYHAIGMCTGSRNEVTVTTTYSQRRCEQKGYRSATIDTSYDLPHFSFYVVPTSLLPADWANDQEAYHGCFMKFTSPVHVLLCVQDWVHSHGFLSLQSRDTVVLMEYGFPQAPIFMPRADMQVLQPNEDGLYGDISLQDLHSLVVALSAHRDPSNGTYVPHLHPRLNKHLAAFGRFQHLEGATPHANLLHGVMRELSARYIQADAQLQDYASFSMQLPRKKRRFIEE